MPSEYHWLDAFTGKAERRTNGELHRYVTLDRSLFVRGPHPWFDVRAFGAAGDGVRDDTAAIQNAINAAQDAVENQSGRNVPTVFFPAGVYSITDTIVWKSAWLVGTFPNGTRLNWNGAAGGTMFQKWDEPHAGSNSFALLSGMQLVGQGAEPATFIDFTTNSGVVDHFCRLQEVQFANCTGDAIKVGAWVNCHWEHLRFDNIGGYAIRLAPPALSFQFLSSFRLDGFTYDHSRSSGAAPGFMRIENPGLSNLGTVYVANGRIEVNTAWASPQAVFTVSVPDSSPPGRSVGLHVANVTYQDAAGMANDVLLYRDTTNTTSREALLLTNVRTGGLSAVIGGTWPATAPPPPVPAGGLFSFWNLHNNEMVSQGEGLKLIPLISDISHAVALQGHLSATTTWDPPSLANGAQTTTTVTVNGAALGDPVIVGFTRSLQGMLLTGYVSAANTVTVVLRNETGGTIDLASGTLRATVLKY